MNITIYELNKQLQSLAHDMRRNTQLLRVLRPTSIDYQKAYEARVQIMLSTIHVQGRVIKEMERAVLNVTPINRKAA